MAAIAGLAGGLIWVSTLPVWLIQRPDQVKVEGNRFLPTQTVRSLLPIAYPQSLLRLEPQAIAQHLKAKTPISEAIVSRQLFPPGLTVRVKERYPVAITLLAPTDLQLLSQKGAKAAANRVGLLDETGSVLPLENYLLLERSVKLPQLKIIGDPDHYRPYWSKLYRETSRSPVKISDVDFQNPANLILKTELGLVHLGSYSARFPEQIRALDRMRKLPNQVNLSQISYIDLRNPGSPVVQIAGSKDAVKATVPSSP